MKLLLTSHGITNKTIADGLSELLGKPFGESNVCVISTATNGTGGDKSWYIKELCQLQALGWQNLFINDVSGPAKDYLLEQLEKSDVLYMMGGQTWYLMHMLHTCHMVEPIQDFAYKKIYVGSSAGCSIASKYLSSHIAHVLGEEKKAYADLVPSSLNLVNFMFKAHYNSPKHPERDIAWYKALAERINYPLYAVDDDSALKVIDNKVEPISEGNWEFFDTNKSTL